MLVLSALLIRPRLSYQPANATPSMDSVGMLQLTWLLGNEPHLRCVRRPESQALREAGMFEIEIGERLREKMEDPGKENGLDGSSQDDNEGVVQHG